MGDGRTEGLSAIGDGGQAAISLTPDIDGMHVRIFESSQLEGSYVGDLLYLNSGVQIKRQHCLLNTLPWIWRTMFRHVKGCGKDQRAPLATPPPTILPSSHRTWLSSFKSSLHCGCQSLLEHVSMRTHRFLVY